MEYSRWTPAAGPRRRTKVAEGLFESLLSLRLRGRLNDCDCVSLGDGAILASSAVEGKHQSS